MTTGRPMAQSKEELNRKARERMAARRQTPEYRQWLDKLRGWRLWGTLATLVSRGRLDLSRSISEIVPLEDVAEGIAKLDRAEGNPIRILVQP